MNGLAVSSGEEARSGSVCSELRMGLGVAHLTGPAPDRSHLSADDSGAPGTGQALGNPWPSCLGQKRPRQTASVRATGTRSRPLHSAIWDGRCADSIRCAAWARGTLSTEQAAGWWSPWAEVAQPGHRGCINSLSGPLGPTPSSRVGPLPPSMPGAAAGAESCPLCRVPGPWGSLLLWPCGMP